MTNIDINVSKIIFCFLFTWCVLGVRGAWSSQASIMSINPRAEGPHCNGDIWYVATRQTARWQVGRSISIRPSEVQSSPVQCCLPVSVVRNLLFQANPNPTCIPKIRSDLEAYSTFAIRLNLKPNLKIWKLLLKAYKYSVKHSLFWFFIQNVWDLKFEYSNLIQNLNPNLNLKILKLLFE